MTFDVLRDLPFSRNQPLNSVDDCYFRILKNEIEVRRVSYRKFKIAVTWNMMIYIRWESHGTCSYICRYI